jgi:hypothetical protein
MKEVYTPFYVLHSGDSSVHHVMFSTDGTELLASTKDGELVAWDLSIMRVKERIKVRNFFFISLEILSRV